MGMRLFVDRYARFMPMRSVGIGVTNLVPNTYEQFDLLGEIERRKILEESIDSINYRYGNGEFIVQKGSVFYRPELIRESKTAKAALPQMFGKDGEICMSLEAILSGTRIETNDTARLSRSLISAG